MSVLSYTDIFPEQLPTDQIAEQRQGRIICLSKRTSFWDVSKNLAEYCDPTYFPFIFWQKDKLQRLTQKIETQTLFSSRWILKKWDCQIGE
jgi:hypothetical protein